MNEKQITPISMRSQSLLFLLSAPVIISLSSLGAFSAVTVGAILSYISLKTRKKKYSFVWPFLLTAGIMTAVTAIPYIGKVSKVLLIISGVGLLAFGIIRLVQYLLEEK